MAELVDALVSGTSDRKIVQVRVLFWAQKIAARAAIFVPVLPHRHTGSCLGGVRCRLDVGMGHHRVRESGGDFQRMTAVFPQSIILGAGTKAREKKCCGH